MVLLVCMPFGAMARDFSSEISSIHSSFVSGNRRADSAPQQSVNGAYRCVELLEIIEK